jgi:AbrB family looped-hinge helix DNA binding protein
MGIKVKVMENGRMVLPAAICKQLGLEKGGTVILGGRRRGGNASLLGAGPRQGESHLCQICRSAGHVGR